MLTTIKTLQKSRQIFFFLIFLLLCSHTQQSFGQSSNISTNGDRKPEIQEKAVPEAETKPDKHLYPFGFHNWDPYEEIQSMREQMDQIFNNFDNRLQMSPFFRKDRKPFMIEPQTDILENEKQYIVTIDIPGAEDGKINVKLEENILSVSATTERDYETQNSNYIRMERSTGTMQRIMTLPGPVENEGMETTYKDGVLTVKIPKKLFGTGTK